METGINPDKVGAVAAAICGVHCMAAPVVLAVVPVGGFSSGSEGFESLFFLCSLAMALWSGWMTWRVRRAVQPLGLLAAGVAILAMPHLLGLPESVHPFTAAVGAFILIRTHLSNMRQPAAHIGHSHP